MSSDIKTWINFEVCIAIMGSFRHTCEVNEWDLIQDKKNQVKVIL